MFNQNNLKEVEELSFSNNTVSRRIDEMFQWVEDKQIERVNLSRWFSLQLFEFTGIGGLSQLINFNLKKLIVFIRYIWMNKSD